VTGLLTGQDIERQLSGKNLGRELLLSDPCWSPAKEYSWRLYCWNARR